MEELREYFKDDNNYRLFIESLKGQLHSLTIGGVLKLTSKLPVYKGASTVLKTGKLREFKEQGYWLKIDKMGTVTLD
jgi:hypothetical protein